jgi:hypothetical protein
MRQEKVTGEHLIFECKKTDSFSNFCLVNFVIFILTLDGRNTFGSEFFSPLAWRERKFLMPRAATMYLIEGNTSQQDVYEMLVNFCLPSAWTKEKRARENAAETEDHKKHEFANVYQFSES